MTLYSIVSGAPVAWAGEIIDNIRYPTSIEDSWSDADLLAIGLYRPLAADPLPSGQSAASSSVQIVNGIPKWVNVLEATPFQNLTKRQVCAALILANFTTDPNTFVLGVLATITDATAKALAINDWDNAPYFERSNALFADPTLLGTGGITPAQIDQFWRLGEQQQA